MTWVSKISDNVNEICEVTCEAHFVLGYSHRNE